MEKVKVCSKRFLSVILALSMLLTSGCAGKYSGLYADELSTEEVDTFNNEIALSESIQNTYIKQSKIIKKKKRKM